MLNELRQRFDAVAARVAPHQLVRMPDPPAQPTVEQVLADSLGQWAKAPETANFLLWLGEEITKANGRGHEALVINHPSAAYYFGYEAALRVLFSRFEIWSGSSTLTTGQAR